VTDPQNAVRSIAVIEARNPDIMVWAPDDSVSGAWEALGDGWLVQEKSPARFREQLEAKVNRGSGMQPAAGASPVVPAAGQREKAAMTDDYAAPFPADQFTYLVLADRLEARIRRGEFSATGQLPTARELMAHYKVGSGSVRHAWAELKGRGLVYTRQGFGMFTT
jgi:hypothetical protein